MPKRFTDLALGSALTLLLSAHTPALAGGAAQSQKAPVYVMCGSDQDPALCKALAEALTQTSAGREVKIWVKDTPVTGSYHMTIRFVQNVQTDDSLSGHLLWQTAGGAPETGPTLEVSVMDAVLTEQILKGFAQHLLQSSDIPM
ncbi:hypothetical protein So717_42340 [Roseobacter cerasinus]|uniref:Lipoprotein n=2 Tax=Roseobacter cerasinus TaxID=2602289 RepID=A0A640VZE6_9RHOB|nr:hypothetical protein So717_42340 [Roseobacter cerasinus]